MKEKSRKEGNHEVEHEKSGFEKLEDEVKGTIFNVLYVLLKEDKTSNWMLIIQILFDYIQIYFFSFGESVSLNTK